MSSDEGAVAKAKLVEFILSFKSNLDLAVSHVDWLVEEERIRALVEDAWREVQPRFEMMPSRIRQIPLEELREDGLVGSQLDLKLAVYNKGSGEFVAWVKEETKSPSDRKPGWKERAWHYFKRMAGPAGTIIGSLPIPGAGAIGEFKDVLEDAAEK